MKKLKLLSLITTLAIGQTITHAQDNSLSFDGIDDYVNLDALTPSFVNNSEFSIEFKMRYNGASDVDVPPSLFSINNSTHDWNGLLLLVNSDGTLAVSDYIPDNTNSSNTYYSSAIINDGLCHHIAYTTDGTTSKVYIDGVFQFDFAPEYTFNLSDKVSLGQEWDDFSSTTPPASPSNFLNGTMDEIRIWSAERSASEINDNMDSQLLGTETDLIALYNCNQGSPNGDNTSITTLVNSTNTSGLNGTLVDFSLNNSVSNFISNPCSNEENVLNFDGTNDYVNLDVLTPTFVNNSEFTIEFKMRYNGVSDIDVPPALFSINNSTHDWNGLLFLINPDGTLRLDDYIPDNTNSANTYYSSTIINDGLCHHIAYTTDGSTSKVYIDGVFQFDFAPEYTFNLSDKVSLGQEWDDFSSTTPPASPSNFLNGNMDEIRIWSAERSASEVNDNMDSELLGTETDLVALYNCNQGIPNGDNTNIIALINNTSTSGLNGTLVDFSLNGDYSNFIEDACIINESVLSFDGKNDYVNLDVLSPIFVNNSEFTIEFKMRYNGVSDIDVPPALFSINNSTHDWNGLLFLINPDGTLRLDDYIPDNTNSANTYYSSTIINDGLCHHIAYTTDGSTSKVYIDGVFQFDFAPEYTFNLSDKVSLGQEWDDFSSTTPPASTSNFLNGNMDEIRIWSTVRTISEVNDNMDSELLGTETDLVALYNCNQGTPNGDNTIITTLINSTSTTALNGTLVDFSLNGDYSNFISPTCEIIDESTDGLVEFDAQVNQLSLYPNPTNSDITIESISNISNVKIFDITGKLVMNIDQTENISTIRIDISDLNSGLYFLIIENTESNQVTTAKFTKID